MPRKSRSKRCKRSKSRRCYKKSKSRSTSRVYRKSSRRYTKKSSKRGSRSRSRKYYSRSKSPHYRKFASRYCGYLGAENCGLDNDCGVNSRNKCVTKGYRTSDHIKDLRNEYSRYINAPYHAAQNTIGKRPTPFINPVRPSAPEEPQYVSKPRLFCNTYKSADECNNDTNEACAWDSRSAKCKLRSEVPPQYR